MKILYTTDLHGYDQYYSDTRKKALENNVDIVINGGDMLPKTGNQNIFKIQKDFITYLEQQYFPLFEKDRIHYLCSLGNDDLRIYDQAFDEACSKFEFVHNIAGRKIEIDGYEFIGFNLVTDYPFQLKDRCRMDKQDYSFQMQYGPGFYSSEKLTWEKIEDWFELAKSLPTIEEELKTLPKPRDPRKTIYVIHMPPAGYDLDTCRSGERPNSMAVKEFIENSDALLSLHGHVHESFKMTGIWNARVGDTIAIQPGQDWSRLVYCLIDIAPFGSQAVKIEMNRHAHPGEMLFDKSPGMVIVSAAKEKEFFIGKYKNEHR